MMLATVGRYLRLLGRFGQYTLAREMAFRGNFLVKVLVEVLWLGFILVFYDTLFARTDAIAGWNRWQYLFFVGCFFALSGTIETFFLENCNEFANLVRTGDLDFLLIKPIDEQFLATCRRVDWAAAPNVLMGAGLMAVSLRQLDWPFDPIALAAFLVLFVCGVAMAYGFILMLTSLSVYVVRNQSLMEMWWLVTNLARYPREIFRGASWAEPIGFVLTFVIPFLLIVNIPSETMVKTMNPGMAAFMIAVTVGVLAFSRWGFKRALRSYRSASS
jgi:ABC-2 type transport system permease protein